VSQFSGQVKGVNTDAAHKTWEKLPTPAVPSIDPVQAIDRVQQTAKALGHQVGGLSDQLSHSTCDLIA
jgi:hypothetical protein